MHKIVRWYIQTGVFYLIVGLAIGVWMIVRKELFGILPNRQLIAAHTHVILVGFVLLMIMGVAQWMFPRPSKEDSHYSPYLAEYIFYTITIGVFIRTSGEIASAFTGSSFWRWMIVTGSILEVLAIIFFFYNMWTRIRPAGSKLREAKGEKF